MTSAVWGLLVAAALAEEPARPVPRLHEEVVIVAEAPDPRLERRDAALLRETLLSRDDQLLQSTGAGLSAGQHEGGGKSLEIRRFGFNLDHGGTGGGLAVLVDNVPQNQGTQGHGQGYLGALKSVIPELVEEIEVLNGPFSAQYGDFAGLGVVHIRMKESLPDAVTVRTLAGSFGTFRGFGALSTRGDGGEGFLAYETARTDGPFLNPLRYARDNLTARYTFRRGVAEAFGAKLNLGKNDFHSSGQIPLDLVEAGALDRFGALDEDGGGRVRALTLDLHHRRTLAGGDVLKLDAFLGRSLFDLYSNFTFFLNDPLGGDEIRQHDSRLQQGLGAQLLHTHRLFGGPALLVTGGSGQASQVRVGLAPSQGRAPLGVATDAHADLANAAAYVQETASFAGGRLRLEGGLRYDLFRFEVNDLVEPAASGAVTAGAFQPKAGVTLQLLRARPLRLHLNYGRGIASQDARGVVRRPEGPKVSTTDFYQVALAHERGRLSLLGDLFWIDRSHEQVYVPDDGSLELAGPSRAYGYELKASAELAPGLGLQAGLTRVLNAYYRNTSPRVYVDGAPPTVANAALTLSERAGFSASLRYRHASGYRLDGEDARVRARGHSVVDFAVSRRLSGRLALNLAVDNLLDAAYYETQNYFESRVHSEAAAVSRIHATPGYPRTITAGLTLTLGPRL